MRTPGEIKKKQRRKNGEQGKIIKEKNMIHKTEKMKKKKREIKKNLKQIKRRRGKKETKRKIIEMLSFSAYGCLFVLWFPYCGLLMPFFGLVVLCCCLFFVLFSFLLYVFALCIQLFLLFVSNCFRIFAFSEKWFALVLHLFCFCVCLCFPS